ncbi:Uma2 family endonuclease [Microcystis sp. CS-574]|uniref:Uma2 family endonuclease n=1 Tax=Microcystis sp. CS-574 TaxID=3021718 RepID=UPI00232C58F6|nr:Uma2 family endonuclease [Microcystis sp. CS-574]MDB9405301.1 Uma2 family endonuclease [Microcystis sp. CS-574]
MTIAKSDETATSPALIEEDFEDFWEPPPPPTDLIFDDGEPLESNRHRIAMNVLIRSLQQGYGERDDFYTGGNMFIYFSREQAKNRDFRGPDFFAVLNVDGTRERQGWVIWEEEGRYPDVIVELTSPSTAKTDKVRKKAIYEGTFRTPDYFIYDPFDGNSLQGWHLGSDQRYHSLERNERGWLWCETLGYWLGTWEGTIDRETAIWARFYDSEGNLIPLPEEAAQEQAAAAQEQAAAAQEQAAATQEQLNATQQALEAERQRSQRLAARLQEMGIEL